MEKERETNNEGRKCRRTFFKGVESVKIHKGFGSDNGNPHRIGRHKEPPGRENSIRRFFVCTEFPGMDFSMER